MVRNVRKHRHSSRKTWELIRSLGNDPKAKPMHITVTPD